MFIRASGRAAGWTLTEMLVASAIFSIASLGLSSLYMLSLRSFAAMGNYAVLNKENRQAVDVITREIRQANRVTDYTTNPVPRLTILNGQNEIVTYTFTPASRIMTRSVDGNVQVMLTNCSLLDFRLYQRNPSNATWNAFDLSSTNYEQHAKVVELSWKTSRKLNPTDLINSEDVQTARIVIRKQQAN